MPHAALPTVTDLENFLLSAKLVSAPPTDEQNIMILGDAVASAQAEWQRETGWVPFLSGADTTRSFNPPGPEQGPVGIYFGVANMGGSRKLFLNAGVRSVTTLKTGVTVQNPTGTTLVLNQDYWLRPNNADTYDRPFTFIEFGYSQWGNPNSITITAPFGFGSVCPDDAWYAILKMAAIQSVPALELAQFGGLVKWGDADANETYNARPFQGVADTWQAQIAPVIGRYKRKIMA